MQDVTDDRTRDTERSRRLLIVSNRGPVEHQFDSVGGLTRKGCAGGVATALDSAAKDRPFTWIAAATSNADRLVARDGRPTTVDGLSLRLVAPPHAAYELHYETFCNPILWFLQHGIWDQLRHPIAPDQLRQAWERGYLAVNQAFAEAVIDELGASGQDAQVMLHDYHLYAAPLLIRNRCPRVTLQHFVHIPWPGPAMWRRLPIEIVESICESLLANDSVAFQTDASAGNFIETCLAYLPDTQLQADGVLERRGRRTRVWANPISVDVRDLRSRLASPAAREYRTKLMENLTERTIVRVDRLDPAKNVRGGFEAFARLLEHDPEWRGRVSFLAFLVPSRTNIEEYREYADETFALVREINRRYGTPSWTPIAVFHEHDRLQALAALSLYDVLLVNSLADGMNLVSKEGPVVNERDGVLVLSTAVGSYAELRAGAIAVPPHDVAATADALARALSLPSTDRRVRQQRLRQAIHAHQLGDWLRELLADRGAAEQPSKPALVGVA